MTEYLPVLITAAGALIAGLWYGRRWGHADGIADGYEAGRTKGLLEGAGVVVSPSLASGGPRERA